MARWSSPEGSRWTDLRPATIAVPGTLTTAFLALRLCLGGEFPFVVVPFDKILDAVAAGHTKAAHRRRPDDPRRTTHLRAAQAWSWCIDTGQWWFDQTGLPLPLGANAMRKDLGPETIGDVQRLLSESIGTAWPIAKRRSITP